MFTPGSDTIGNGVESARRAGYKGNENTLTQTAFKLVRNGKIIDEKQRIQSNIAKELKHNREIAIKLLTDNLARLTVKANNGDVQAASAITGVIRELNAISNLHTSTVQTKDISDSPRPANIIDKSRDKLLKLKTG